MAAYDTYTVDSIDGDVGQFKVENGQAIGKAFELLNYEEYPDVSKEIIDEINSRGQLANEMYKLSRHREQMFASGFEAGMYIARFDENEELLSFEFTDGTRKMLGYDGLEDLPNEFDSWVKTLIPEERDILVKLFWDTVKIHRELPDISHAEYRMMKKDGSIIWVTGAGEFVRREDGTLEIYMGCYREVTAEHEKEEYLHIIEGVGKVFNFSIYIDANTEKYRFISTNEYVNKVQACENAFEFLRANVEYSVGEAYKKELLEWFDCATIRKELKEHGTVSKDFYSEMTDAWFKGIFLVGDYDEDGEIAHIIYGCQDIDDTKKKEIESQKEILEQYHLLKSVSDIYYSMHEIDLVHNSVTAYKSEADVDRIVKQEAGAELMMRRVMSANTKPQYVKRALEFTDLTTLPERLKNKKAISDEFEGNNLGWFTTTFITVKTDDEGRPTKVIFTTNSIDEIKRKEENLIQQSTTDELTGAYNRRAYEDAIAGMAQEGIAEDFVYISVDVNGLKVVNDSIGHSAGDELIQGAYACLVRTFGTYGKVYRTGGDEFIVLANVSEDRLTGVRESLLLTTERWSGDLVDSLSMSFGLVTRSEATDMDIRDIAILADKRMYEAKNLYYKKQGVDRRGQRDAHTALCALYTKILKINITDDTYQIVNMDVAEQKAEKGFADKISTWLKSFGTTGQVHPDDLEEYLKKTDLAYLNEYFSGNKTSLHVFYRRKYEDGFKQVMMELIPANDYKNDDKSLFLYVKNIDA